MAKTFRVHVNEGAYPARDLEAGNAAIAANRVLGSLGVIHSSAYNTYYKGPVKLAVGDSITVRVERIK